jgi:hypothetical protein
MSDSGQEKDWQSEWIQLQNLWRPRLCFDTDPGLIHLLESDPRRLKFGGVDLSFVEGSILSSFLSLNCHSISGPLISVHQGDQIGRIFAYWVIVYFWVI